MMNPSIVNSETSPTHRECVKCGSVVRRQYTLYPATRGESTFFQRSVGAGRTAPVIRTESGGDGAHASDASVIMFTPVSFAARSEERRVGKEWRSRGWPYRA